MNSPSLVVAAWIKSANKIAVGLTEVVFVNVCVDSEKVPVWGNFFFYLILII